MQELFFLAVELDGDVLARFLDQECDGDCCLRSEVESLLQADRSAEFHLTVAIKAEAKAMLGEFACRTRA